MVGPPLALAWLVVLFPPLLLALLLLLRLLRVAMVMAWSLTCRGGEEWGERGGNVRLRCGEHNDQALDQSVQAGKIDCCVCAYDKQTHRVGRAWWWAWVLWWLLRDEPGGTLTLVRAAV